MAITFNTIDSSVSAGTPNTIFVSGGSFTFSCWINPTVDDVGGGGDPRIFSKYSSLPTHYGLGFEITATKALLIDMSNGVPDNMTVITNNNLITFSSWQNILVTGDGSLTASNYHIYINGVEATYLSQVNGAGPFLVNNNGETAYIGNRADVTRPFGGTISELMYWNSILSSGDIATVSTARRRGICFRVSTATLVSYWPFEDVAAGTNANGATLRDAFGTNPATGNSGTSGTGHTGTVGEPISYMFHDDKHNPRGLHRGILQGVS